MTKKAKKEILQSVKANVSNQISVSGAVKYQLVFFNREATWGSKKRVVTFDEMINDPIATLKQYPRLRSKFECSDDAFDLILSTPLSELSNLLNSKDDAKEINDKGRVEPSLYRDGE